MVSCVDNAVHQRVAQQHVGVSHVDFCPQHLGAVGILALLHLLKEAEILLHGAVAPGALLARSGHRAAAHADFLLTLVVDIGQALLYQSHGPLVELVKIVGCVEFVGPLKAQPLDILLDRVNVFGILLHGVGVVKAQVGGSAVFLGETKVQADALCVADMQVAVGFRRETGHYGFMLSAGQIGLYDIFKEIVGTLFHIFCFDSNLQK